jgi:uncharacterized protein YxjI
MFQRRSGECHDTPGISVIGAALPRYRLVERIASIAEDFVVQDDHGQRAFILVGKKHRLRGTLILRDLQGSALWAIPHRTEQTRDSMEINGPDGRILAKVERTMITPLRDRYLVKIGEQDVFEVEGNIVAHEYRIENFAKISTFWFRMRNSYGVEVTPGQNVPLVLATTICIDQMTSELN